MLSSSPISSDSSELTAARMGESREQLGGSSMPEGDSSDEWVGESRSELSEPWRGSSSEGLLLRAEGGPLRLPMGACGRREGRGGRGVGVLGGFGGL
jgi:hypothetical protein